MIERLLAGEEALGRDELDAAERLFSQVAAADPRNAIALVGLARVAIRLGDRAQARDLAERALAIDQDEAAAVRLLAELGRPAAPEPTPAPLAPETTPAAPEPTPAPVARNAPMAPTRRVATSRWRAWLARLLRRG